MVSVIAWAGKSIRGVRTTSVDEPDVRAIRKAADISQSQFARLHDELASHGKAIRMEIYEHGYHGFELGPQGHAPADLPQDEILLQGTLDALERTLQFVKTPQ